jgi:hypothetical protein
MLVLWVSGVFRSKYPHWCKPLKFETWGQYIPPGNWCIDVGANWHLVVRAQSKFDVMVAGPAEIQFADPSRLLTSKTNTSRGYCHGPLQAFSTATVTPPEETMVYVKVRYPQESDVSDCWYYIPIPNPK